jgi:GAF domain-containing protein
MPPGPAAGPRFATRDGEQKAVVIVQRETAQARDPRAAPPAASPGRRRGASGWTRGKIEALLRVNRAIALEPNLADVLSTIAAEACNVTGAKAVSILLAEPGEPFHLAASRGLSRDYALFLQGHFISYGRSVARAAADQLKPIVVEDVANDPRVNRREARDWKLFALRENYRAILSVPLIAGRKSSGVLNLYRAQAGPWSAAEIEVTATFGQYAASAILSAKLIDSQRRQVDALERLVDVLRDQTHEYANRLHAIAGLLALGETLGAQEFLAQLMTIHHDNYESVIERVHHPILAGLLIAQMSIARQRGVEVRLDDRTSISALPHGVGAAEAVTIVANLIENAVEAVATMPASRRRVAVRIAETRTRLTITVRDWGPGIDRGTEAEIVQRGLTSKDGHPGIGLALVSEAVASARGTLSISHLQPGVAFCVALPRDPRRRDGGGQP